MVVVRNPGLHLLRSIAVVIEGPQLHRLVFTSREEVILSSQRGQTLCGARVTQEALQSYLVEVEMWILLVEANLVLPVGQPVALQGAATARELLLQCTVLWSGALHPGGGGGRDGSRAKGWSGEAGGGGGASGAGGGVGVAGSSPRVGQTQVPATVIFVVLGHLDTVSYQVAPKRARLREGVSR